MCAALCVEDVVAESKNILMELIYILNGKFNNNAVALTLDIDRLAHGFFLAVQILDEAQDSLRLMEGDFFIPSFPVVPEYDRKVRVQIGGLVQTVLDISRGETCRLREDGFIRKK